MGLISKALFKMTKQLWWQSKQFAGIGRCMHRHIHNIPPDILRASVEIAAIRFNLLSENVGRHIEQ